MVRFQKVDGLRLAEVKRRGVGSCRAEAAADSVHREDDGEVAAADRHWWAKPVNVRHIEPSGLKPDRRGPPGPVAETPFQDFQAADG
jgi:hypothetical protein